MGSRRYSRAVIPFLLVSISVSLGANGPGVFVTGRYRNLFVDAGHSEQEVEAKISAAFPQLFHGDPHTRRLYYPAGTNANGPPTYLPDVAHNDVRSEGMSYGMMVAVRS